MKVCIIGANGFFGASLAKKCVDKGVGVVAVYNDSYDKIPQECHLVRKNDLSAIKNEKFKLVYICIGNYALSKDLFDNQAIFIQEIINTLSFDRILFVSSVTVYGGVSDLINVNSSLDCQNIYGLSKINEEKIIQKCPNYGIVRYTYLYGISMGENSLIPRWVKSARENNLISIFGDGGRNQDYLHIDDAVELAIEAGEKFSNFTIIGASGLSVSNLDLASMISSHFPTSKLEFKSIDTTPSSRFDISDTLNIVTWRPSVSLENGIKQYIEKNENANI